MACGSKENHLTVLGYHWPHVTGRRPELSRRAVNFVGKREESDEDGYHDLVIFLRVISRIAPGPCLSLLSIVDNFVGNIDLGNSAARTKSVVLIPV